MKYFLFISLSLLIISCDHIDTQRVIPKENIAKADSFITKQMESIKITNRYEDEDFEYFLIEAKNNALTLYGRDTIGIYNSNVGFIPYALCTPEEKAKINKRLK